MVRSVAVVLAAVLLFAAASTAPLAATGSDSAAPTVQSPVGATESPSFSSTHFRIAVHPNGSATWTFQYRTQLENDSERERFRQYARSFEANETRFVEQFRANARSLVADGETVTGREMNATTFERAAFTRGLSDGLGVVQLSFTWTNFARTDGERVVVGDLFDGGLYLGSNQRLVVTADPGLAFASVSPTPNATADPTFAASDSVTWFGPREFTDERPRAVLVPNDSVGAGEGGATTGSTSSTADTDGGDGLPVSLLGGLLALLAVGSAVAYWRRERLAAALGGASDADASPAADASRDPDADAPPVGDPAVSDEEMLADDERVERLLREHGGRMRQASIVEETDWSKSKVSMLLSEMEDDDRISRLRVGRENVVSLPGHEPTTGRDEE